MSRRIVFTKRLQLLGALSIPSGMPLGWVFTTFQVFLKDLGISRSEIGFLSSVSLPWTLKFLWAPLVDRFAFPWPGRRRSWVILMQLGLALALGALARAAFQAVADHRGGRPVAALPIALLALLVAFLAATQDIAYDAYAVELLTPEEHGPAAGTRAVYYRAGMLLGGNLAVGQADLLGWPATFGLLALLFAACVPLVLWSPEPSAAPPPPRDLRRAVVEPLRAFFTRADAIPVALFLVLYKFGDNLAGTMVNPFLKDLCFSNAEIGYAVKVVGIASAMVGSAAAVGITLRLGVGRSLWILGVLQAAANLLYAATARSRGLPLESSLCGVSLPPVDAATRAWAYLAIGGEQGAQAMASVAQGALLLRICDKRYSASQFALLSSFFALGRWSAGLPSGWLADRLGYPTFFTLCATVAALPGFYFLQRISPLGRREPLVEAPPP